MSVPQHSSRLQGGHDGNRAISSRLVPLALRELVHIIVGEEEGRLELGRASRPSNTVGADLELNVRVRVRAR